MSIAYMRTISGQNGLMQLIEENNTKRVRAKYFAKLVSPDFEKRRAQKTH